MSRNKKKFFDSSTPSKILNKPHLFYVSSNIISKILETTEEQGIIIQNEIIPEKFDSSKQFLKHGPELQIHKYQSLEEAIKNDVLPTNLFSKSLNSSQKIHSGYTFRPLVGTDKRKRKFNLVEVVEGAKIYIYANQTRWQEPLIKVTPYDGAKRISEDGAELYVEVPSRTQKRSRHKFKFSGVPVVRNSRRHGLIYGISTDHSCGSKTFNIRYKFESDKEGSKIFNFDAHEIAAYFSIIDYYSKQKNKTPLHMNTFPIPTNLTLEFYEKLENNCLITSKEGKEPKKLNNAQKQILMEQLVYKLGHRKTLYRKEKLKNYK